MDPCSRKGEIRARAAERLFDAHRRGEIVATSGRASDFYGPGGTLTGLGDFFWPRALAGRTAYSPYPLDVIHTYHYIPDVAEGLATLGCADSDVYGCPWMLPCAPAGTLRDLVSARCAQRAGATRARGASALSDGVRRLLETQRFGRPVPAEGRSRSRSADGISRGGMVICVRRRRANSPQGGGVHRRRTVARPRPLLRKSDLSPVEAARLFGTSTRNP
jgi:hypothetical protein